MISYWTKISLCISFFFIGCSADQNKDDFIEEHLNYSDLTYGLKIDQKTSKTIKKLENLGLEKTDTGFEDKNHQLNISINLSGYGKIDFWKIEWKGKNDVIKTFSKRLLNVLKTEYPEIQGSENYYAHRFQSGNAQVILELIIWEDRIELTNR